MENGVLAKDMATTRVVTTRVVTTRVRTTAAKAQITAAKSQIGTGEVGTPTSTSSGWDLLDLRGPRGPEEALAMDDEACSQGAWDNRCPRFRARVSRGCTGALQRCKPSMA